MSAMYRHRKNRPLHLARYGWHHFKLHRNGVRHRHTRGNRLDRPDRERASWRAVPRRLWRREIIKQALIGALIGVVVVVVLAVIFGVIAFENARHDLSRAQNIAKHLIDDRTILLSTAGRATATEDLARMHYFASQAADELGGSIAVTVLRDIPIVGYQVSSLNGAVDDVDVLAGQGQALLTSAINTIDASHGTSINLPALAALDKQTKSSATRITAMEATASGLWGPVHTERVKLNNVLSEVATLLDRGVDALNFAQPFLGADGPRTYLVVGQNNAEMRDQGAVLSFALLHANDGTFTMSDAASVGKIALRSPAEPVEPASTAAVFGDLDPTQIWQSVNANANFPTSAQWMIAMFHKARGITVNGVVAVDVQTLANILKVTGPVTVSDIHQPVSTTNVASLLLYKLYLQYPAGSQAGRHDDITEVAQAAVHRMGRVHYDLGYFFDELAKASQGRHLLFYDTNPVLERTVRSFGGSGAILAGGSNTVHLAIEAGVAAKLDWFMHDAVTYQIQVNSHGAAFVTTTIILHNDAPRNAKPSYALGPGAPDTVAGEYIGRIYLWLPRGATAPGAVSEEGLSLERAVQTVKAQQTEEVIFTATIPHAVHKGKMTWIFVPQSLIHAPKITVEFSATGGFSGPADTTWQADQFKELTWRPN